MKLGSLLPVLKTLFRMRCCWLGVEAQFKGQLSLTQAHRVSSRRSALTVEGINIIECQRRAANGAEQHGAGAASCSDDDGASLKNYHHRRFAGTEAAAGRRDSGAAAISGSSRRRQGLTLHVRTERPTEPVPSRETANQECPVYCANMLGRINAGSRLMRAAAVKAASRHALRQLSTTAAACASVSVLGSGQIGELSVGVVTVVCSSGDLRHG